MIFKILKYSPVLLAGGMMISETFHLKVDRNLIRPIRNFSTILNDNENWFMKENCTNFGKELIEGFGKMFIYEDQENY